LAKAEAAPTLLAAIYLALWFILGLYFPFYPLGFVSKLVDWLPSIVTLPL
jgi:hypothetical protein